MCPKLALRETFKVFKLLKEERRTLVSETILQKHQEEKEVGLLITKITKRVSPSTIIST
jgi:hypothetical protein